ncbi:MAG TPA: hypothetical protein VGD01_15445 [Candidatus Elarobacter sp.]
MQITHTIRRLAVAAAAAALLAACGGGGGGGGGGSSVTPPGPSGVILFGLASGQQITSSPANPYPVNMSSGFSPIFTAQESGFSGTFTVSTACSTSACQTFGPSLKPTNGTTPPAGSPPNTTTFPSGGAFAFQCGLVCVQDGHIETATISDGLGHSVTEYFQVI